MGTGPEKLFENRIKNYLDSKGNWYVKFFAHGMTRKGVPDILCSMKGKFVGIEVKSEVGKPSLLQIRNIDLIQEDGGYCVCVRPSQMDELKEFIDNPSKDKECNLNKWWQKYRK